MLAGVAAGLARYFGVDPADRPDRVRDPDRRRGAGIPLYLAPPPPIPDEGSDVSIAGFIIESLQSRSR